MEYVICNPKATCLLNLSLLPENTGQALYFLHVPNVKEQIGINWLQSNYKKSVPKKCFVFETE